MEKRTKLPLCGFDVKNSQEEVSVRDGIFLESCFLYFYCILTGIGSIGGEDGIKVFLSSPRQCLLSVI